MGVLRKLIHIVLECQLLVSLSCIEATGYVMKLLD